MASTHPNFRTEQQIASNKISDVFLATQISMNRQVIEKRLKFQFQSSSIIKQRFVSDVTQLARLNHPNIVQLLDFFPESLSVYMEFINGDSLDDYRKKYGEFSAGDSLWIVKQILEALNYAHKNNVDHFDLQPRHIYISNNDSVKVTGFSLANMIRMTHSEHQLQTDDVFDIQYTSPELIEEKPIDQRSDIYSVGVILYELLTGKTPFSGTPLQIAIKHANELPKVPSELNPKISKQLDQLVLKAVQKNAELRYQNAYEFIQAILNFVKNNEASLGAIKFAQFVIPTVQTADAYASSHHSAFQSTLDASEAKAIVDNQTRIPKNNNNTKKSTIATLIVWVGGITFLALVLGILMVFYFTKKSPPVESTTNKSETTTSSSKPENPIVIQSNDAQTPKLPSFDNKAPTTPKAEEPIYPPQSNSGLIPDQPKSVQPEKAKKEKLPINEAINPNLSLEKGLSTSTNENHSVEQPQEQPKPKKEKPAKQPSDLLQGIEIPPANEKPRNKQPESEMEIMNGR